tara:strand:+ start:94361 stop:94504 length:144 start_codon:yes stop_codon:yes gene_type:complete
MGKVFDQPIPRLLSVKRHKAFQDYTSIVFGHDDDATREIGQRWRKVA